MLSNHLIICCTCLLLSSIFPRISVFSSELALHIRWLKYWSFTLSTAFPMNIQGWFPFRIDWFDLQEILKSLLQHHNSKASILWHSAFFMVQLLHPYMTTGKIIALTIQAIVRPLSLLFNKVIACLPKIKCLLIFIAAVIDYSDFGTPKIKSVTVSTSPHLFAMK